MVFNFFCIFVSSLLLSLFVTSRLLRIRGCCEGRIPQIGGIAIWFSFSVVALLSLIFGTGRLCLTKEIIGVFSCSTFIFIVGLIDDKRELSVLSKLFAQLVISFIVLLAGVKTQIAGIGLMGNIIVSLLWILGITNAFNHLDIVDGLSASIAFLSTMVFFIFSTLTGSLSVSLILISFAGAILGFLRYNFPKAKIYMGNCGSHFLGFVLSTLAIMISYATLEKRAALFIPLLVLGFPVFDTIFLIWMRLLKHKPIWLKSDDHLTLRLIAMGFSHKKAVLIIFLLSTFFSIIALTILLLSNQIGIILLILLLVLCLAISLKMKRVINQ